MKKLFYLFPVLFAMILTSCSKELSDLTKFDVSLTDSITLPAIPVAGIPAAITSPDISTTTESKLSKYKSSTDLVEKINLKSIELTITSPDTVSFSFLKNIKLYISAEGMSETELAVKDSIPENVGKTLKLDVANSIDFKDYILKRDNIKIRMQAETDKTTNSEYKIKINPVFTVDAKILGL